MQIGYRPGWRRRLRAAVHRELQRVADAQLLARWDVFWGSVFDGVRGATGKMPGKVRQPRPAPVVPSSADIAQARVSMSQQHDPIPAGVILTDLLARTHTIGEAAEELGLSKSMIKKLITTGKLPAHATPYGRLIPHEALAAEKRRRVGLGHGKAQSI